MKVKAGLGLGIAVIVGVLAWVAVLAAPANLQYYLLVDECVSQGNQLCGQRLRLSGRVAAHSLQIAEDRRTASFQLQGTQHRLAVTCHGPIPDNLTEEIEVVVEGSLGPDGCFQAGRVITRCASKYAPKQSPPAEAGAGVE
jgi:cytochrome c-type biogenesis protein CcmE